MLIEKHKIGFRGNNKRTSGFKWPLTTNPHFVCNIHKPVCLQNRISFGLEHMAARSRGNETHFDWLRKSCDISTCDLSPDGNPEKYAMPMKSAIAIAFCLATVVLLHVAIH